MQSLSNYDGFQGPVLLGGHHSCARILPLRLLGPEMSCHKNGTVESAQLGFAPNTNIVYLCFTLL